MQEQVVAIRADGAELVFTGTDSDGFRLGYIRKNGVASKVGYLDMWTKVGVWRPTSSVP